MKEDSKGGRERRDERGIRRGKERRRGSSSEGVGEEGWERVTRMGKKRLREDR